MDNIFLLTTALSVLLAVAFSMYACLSVMEEHFGALYARIRDLEEEIATLKSKEKDD